MARAEVDPYYTVRDHVQGQIDRIRVKSSTFRELLRSNDPSSIAPFKETRKALVKDLRTVDRDLKGLKEAVDSVVRDRSRFVKISDHELDARKKFVEDARNTVTEIKNSLDSAAVRKKLEADENARPAPQSSAAAAYSESLEASNSEFVTGGRQQMKSLLAQQDANVAQLSTAVDGLHILSAGINEELREQNVLLDGLEGDISGAQTRLDTVQNALQKLLKTKDNCQIWLIVILTLILAILVALVIWT